MLRRLTRTRANPDRQREVLDAVTGLPAEKLTQEQIESVFETAARPANNEIQMTAAVLLSEFYPALAPNNPDFASRTHTILMRDLRLPRRTLAHPSCSWLVMTHLREENLAHIPWESANEVASAAECFYAFTDAGLSIDESNTRVRDLVKYAGMRFAEQGRWEEVFSLLSRVPIPPDVMDADMFRLRNLLLLYEQRRVQHMQRLLAIIIAVAAIFVIVISPLLFMTWENTHRIAKGMRALSFPDAIYWSIITFSTVGYGEIVPTTFQGKTLAVFDALLGVTLTGVIAGLILSRVTQRQLT